MISDDWGVKEIDSDFASGLFKVCGLSGGTSSGIVGSSTAEFVAVGLLGFPIRNTFGFNL